MKIETGYTPGIIGSVVELHARYYSQTVGFGSEFESIVATGLSDFISRLENDQNQIWHIKSDDRIVASIAIDGEDLGANVAHLRWFIVDGSARGTGAGSKLLERSVEFCQAADFERIDLWTFKGLDTARYLYEKHGFVLTDEYQGRQWGEEVTEQKFSLRLR